MISNKKGDIWISAVLYFGLGIVVLSLILAAGMPVINKLRDKNIVIQAKEVLFKLDNNIREVARGGPGTQRLITIDIKKGNFKIDENSNQIMWEYEGKAMLSELGSVIEEGTLRTETKEGNEKGEYVVKMWVPYTSDNRDKLLQLNQEGIQTLQGTSQLIIKNAGAPNGIIQVEIKEK